MSTTARSPTTRGVNLGGVPVDNDARKPAELHFLVSNNVEKPDADLRKFIRRHVMKGKNKGKTPRPSNKPRKPRKGKKDSPESSDRSQSEDLIGYACGPLAVAPRKFGATWSAARLASDIDPSAVEVVLQLSTVAKFILFPLEPCVLFERRAENWIAPLAVDPIYLHTMIFAARYYFHSVSSYGPMPVDPHLVKALHLLREKIEGGDDHANISGSTIAAMMSLSSHALLMGDIKGSRNHLHGLCKIINLKGGIACFLENQKLLIEILRIDIGASLQSGLLPLVFPTLASCRQIPYPDLKPLLDACENSVPYAPRDLKILIDDADEELSRIWSLLSEFCFLINSIVESKQRISTTTLLNVTSSSIYRLLSMQFDSGSANEAIRLGLLAFCCNVFLQWRNFGMQYTHLASIYQDCLLQLPASSMPPGLWLWLLVIGGISLFDGADYGWLRPLLVTNASLWSIETWEQMKDVLEGFMWIRMVQDKPGKALFNSITACQEDMGFEYGADFVIPISQES